MPDLHQVRHSLLDLHQCLVNVERKDYERTHGAVSAGAFLQLLINDPAFTWLKPLTALIVNLDELEEAATRDGAELEAGLAQITRLLYPDPEGDEFQRHFAGILERSPEAVLAHVKAQQQLA